MKFGYAIVLALVALVAVVGFASADRLPSQVPENQVFTIDTLIDATGAVSEASSMQWVLDDQKIKHYVISRDDNTQFPFILSDDEILALEAAGVDVTVDQLGAIQSIDVPASMVDKVVPNSLFIPGVIVTYQDLIDAILDTGDDEYSSETTYDTGYIHDSKLNPTETIMLATWTDELRSNGGKTSLNKNIDFDSKNKVDGMNNLEVEKVLTYASTEGAHLTGAESWTLDVAGNYKKTEDTIRCVFASSASKYFPAFCNVVKAKSELVNVNSAQISTKGALRGVAATGDVPAALSYQIAVTPDSNSGSGFADGTIKTMFGGSIMEARDNHQNPSATNSWKDSASVTGGIKNFQKTFAYQSGFTY